MPMIDLYMSEGALDPDARDEAVEKLTNALLRHEGASEDNAYVRAMAWVLVHELPWEAMNVGGRAAGRALYRVLVRVPAGTLLQGPGPFGAAARRNLVREVAEILLAAEGTQYSTAEAGRVYCLIEEVADGYWGGLGTTFRMEDIIATATPDAAQTAISEEARAAIDEATAVRP
jgi:phenylpyruvate tautomerase PptA (4-oxalocrotonate tautomerase family)